MKLVYDYALMPDDRELLSNINSAANRLFEKLSNFDVLSVENISDYNKQYFGNRLKNLVHTLQFSSYILSWSLTNHCIEKYSDFIFLEYGAGSGMTSLLAKELGLRVIYNDVYDVSCHDAMTIAKLVENEADHYVHGELDNVIDFLQKNNLACDSIVSSDVIEHIYDIGYFFRRLAFLPGHSLSVVMASGANIFHPYVRKRLMAKQRELENTNREREWGHKERDTLRAYKDIREEMILTCFNRWKRKPSEKEMRTLVSNTRGMIKTDIEKSVNDYLQTGKYPIVPSHPTNTCDPYTGNWAEHLMNPYDLASILSNEGFKTRVLCGYYGNMSGITRRLPGKILDKIIHSSILGKNSITLAPFYTVYGKRSRSSSNR